MSIPPHADRHHRRLPVFIFLTEVEKGFEYTVHTTDHRLHNILVLCENKWRCVELEHFAHTQTTSFVRFQSNRHTLDVTILQNSSKVIIQVYGEGIAEHITVGNEDIMFANRSKAPVDSDASDNDMHVDSDARKNDIDYASQFMTDSDAESVDLSDKYNLNFNF